MEPDDGIIWEHIPELDREDGESKYRLTAKRLFLRNNFVRQDVAKIVREMRQVSGLSFEEMANKFSGSMFTIDAKTLQNYAGVKVYVSSERLESIIKCAELFGWIGPETQNIILKFSTLFPAGIRAENKAYKEFQEESRKTRSDEVRRLYIAPVKKLKNHLIKIAKWNWNLEEILYICFSILITGPLKKIDEIITPSSLQSSRKKDHEFLRAWVSFSVESAANQNFYEGEFSKGETQPNSNLETIINKDFNDFCSSDIKIQIDQIDQLKRVLILLRETCRSEVEIIYMCLALIEEIRSESYTLQESRIINLNRIPNRAKQVNTCNYLIFSWEICYVWEQELDDNM